MPSSAHVPASAAAAVSRLAAPMSYGKPAQRLPLPALVAYGAFGMPLAMAALPLYVHLPRFYGEHLGVGLAALGVLLLLLRVADGLLDPLLGAWSDRAPSRRALIALSAPALAVGMIALFSPTVAGEGALLAWLGVSLALVYVASQPRDDQPRRVGRGARRPIPSSARASRRCARALRCSASWSRALRRECSAAPAATTPACRDSRSPSRCSPHRLACVGARSRCAAGATHRQRGDRSPALRSPLADPPVPAARRRVPANGIASAIPATLVLFFIADVLQAEARQGLFLALYFVAGAAGMPLWIRLSARVGKVRAWASRCSPRSWRSSGLRCWAGRRHRVRDHLRAVGARARRRSRAAAVAARRRHRPRRPHARDRRVLRRVDARDQAQPRAGGGHRAAAARRARLHAWRATPRRWRAGLRLCGRAVRTEARRHRRARLVRHAPEQG